MMIQIKAEVQHEVTRCFRGNVRSYLDETFQANGQEEEEVLSFSHTHLSPAREVICNVKYTVQSQQHWQSCGKKLSARVQPSQYRRCCQFWPAEIRSA
jgi:hypothetical protein